MHQLMYLSSQSCGLSQEDLHDILTTSRSNNTLLGVSGLLLFYNGSFLQILEGKKAVVHDLYLKIMQDRRHGGVVTIFRRNIESRDFAEWSMGFKDLSSNEWERLSGFTSLNNKQKFLQNIESKSVETVTMIKTFFNVNAR